MSGSWIQDAVHAAQTLPTGLSKTEHASWVVRGLCEALFFGLAFGIPTDTVDDAVAALAGHGKEAHPRFADRLRGLRATAGRPPIPYQTLGAACRSEDQTAMPDAELFVAFCELADAVYPVRGPDQEPQVDARSGAGREAILRWTPRRPTGRDGREFQINASNLPADLTWRIWTHGPSGHPTVVAVEERLTPAALDVWWGIHNGTHLDHLAAVADASGIPMLVEYGGGLLSAESLAMSVELLVGLETDDVRVRHVIWEGLAERLARLPHPVLVGSVTAEAAVAQIDVEFAPLPTLARAYTVGAVRLIAGGFDDPYIPTSIQRAVADRWNALTGSRPTIANILERL